MKITALIFASLLAALPCRAQDWFAGASFTNTLTAPVGALRLNWAAVVAQGAGTETLDIGGDFVTVGTPSGYSTNGEISVTSGEKILVSATGERETIFTDAFTVQAPEPGFFGQVATAGLMLVFWYRRKVK